MPPGRRQRGGIPLVALNVALEFREPVIGVGSWRYAVYWAAMPEAAETLNCDPLAREHDVRTKPMPGHQCHVFAETQTATMELATERHLVTRIGGSVALHDGAHVRGRGLRRRGEGRHCSSLAAEQKRHHAK